MLLNGGCAWQQYTAKPLRPETYVAEFEQKQLGSEELRQFLAERGIKTEVWPPGAWNVEALELAALYLHSELVLARAEIDIAKAQEISAGARPNPDLNLDVEHHSDTPGDRTPWSIGPSLDWVFERGDKRAARLERAAAQTERARIDLRRKVWEVRRGVRDRCLEYHDAMSRIDGLKAQSEVLEEGVRLLHRREELGLTSSFEVSSMRVEAQRAQLARSSAEAKVQTAQAALASALGVPLTALKDAKLDTVLFDSLPLEDALNRESLQRRALTARTDLRRAVQDYAVAEAALREEIAKQYPDFTLSPGYFFDQTDNIWKLGAAFLLPILNRNEGPIAEAQARREFAAHRVESAQAAVIGEVQIARAVYLATRRSAAEAGAIVDSLSEQEQKVRREFELGETDRLAMVRAQLETANARMVERELITEVWRGVFRLEDATQSVLRPGVSTEAMSAP